MDKNTQEQIRSARNYIKAGAICSGISLIVGGVLLGVVGLICILIGWSRFKKVYSNCPINASLEEQMKKMFWIAIGVCVISIILNAATIYIRLPEIMYAVQSGDVMSLYGSAGASGAIGSGAGTSTWG